MPTIDDVMNPAEADDALSAAHESGHVIVLELLGCSYDFVTLADDDGPARVQGPLFDIADTDWAEKAKRVVVAFAGIIAEAQIFQRRPRLETITAASGDIEIIKCLLGPRARDKPLIERLQDASERMVYANLILVKRVAKALMRTRRLTPEQVRAAFDGKPLVMPEVSSKG